MALPTASELTGLSTTNAQMKTYLAGMRDFIANIFGTTETASAARASLGAGTVGDAIFQAGTAVDVKSAAPIQSAAPVAASGTAVDFTSIPSWVKRITVQFTGLSLSGTALPIVQIGDSGGVETSGYEGASFLYSAGNFTSTYSSGFVLSAASAATSVHEGTVTLTLVDASSNTWLATISLGSSAGAAAGMGSGSKSLTGTLDRVRLTSIGGTNTFDGGKVNILYE